MTLLDIQKIKVGQRLSAKDLKESGIVPRTGKKKAPINKQTGNENKLTEQFDCHLAAYGIGGFVKEHKFHPVRKWQFDRAWLDLKIAVEVNGGTAYSAYKMVQTKSGVKRVPSSRHISPEGYRKDREKVNTAQSLGWQVFEFDALHIKEGYAVPWLVENTRLGGLSKKV